MYDNYTIILNKAENDEYEMLKTIAEVTRSEYINYINNMTYLIVAFENDTLIFLENILIELKNISVFQLDVLYDIIDVIYDGNLVFKEFTKKLFKAVDRGVTTFKYDLRDYIEEIIGELLYLTDFLSVNINKNEILINAIKLEDRERVTYKLKNFRNIILRIMEILNDKIIRDYEQEMSSNNQNNIKSNKENLVKTCIENINNKTDNVTTQIKNRIHLLDKYEKYANNIEIINEINNKSYIELNNELYSKILKDINKISPDYLDNKSNLIQNKNKLFNLSKEIVDIINLEINEINEYINLYSINYINENNYKLDYNLYNFRKYFTNEFLYSLFNDFKLIVKEALVVHYIQTIKENYKLAFEYFNEVQSLINSAPSYRLLGTIFINYYSNYKSAFQEFAYLPSSNEFLSFVENNFYNVSNYVLDYINKKIQSINKYYFNESQRDVFYRLELIDKEIGRLSNNINNFFNEINLQTEINSMILNITFDLIATLNSENIKTLDNLYILI